MHKVDQTPLVNGLQRVKLRKNKIHLGNSVCNVFEIVFNVSKQFSVIVLFFNFFLNFVAFNFLLVEHLNKVVVVDDG